MREMNAQLCLRVLADRVGNVKPQGGAKSRGRKRKACDTTTEEHTMGSPELCQNRHEEIIAIQEHIAFFRSMFERHSQLDGAQDNAATRRTSNDDAPRRRLSAKGSDPRNPAPHYMDTKITYQNVHDWRLVVIPSGRAPRAAHKRFKMHYCHTHWTSTFATHCSVL